jgi:hypothetical protein
MLCVPRQSDSSKSGNRRKKAKSTYAQHLLIRLSVLTHSPQIAQAVVARDVDTARDAAAIADRGERRARQRLGCGIVERRGERGAGADGGVAVVGMCADCAGIAGRIYQGNNVNNDDVTVTDDS